MNKEVNFEIAKLLKEKGYKDKNIMGAVRLSEPKFYDDKGIVHDIKDAFYEKDLKVEDCCNAPTIANVVMWLYEKHKIWIYVDGDCRPHIIKDNVDLNHKGEVNRIVLLDGKTKVQYCWDSPTEAYESAINYTLENLI